MFNVDPKVLNRMAPHLDRVLVIDVTAGGARLTGELMKQMGARHVAVATRGDQLTNLIHDYDPQVILTELNAPGYDALEFVARLRRSSLRARQAPVIIITSDATAASILGARNAGAHEFLKKPYTAGDLFRRVENVVLKPRPWIEAQAYVGPDRRRFNSGAEYAGPQKRRNDGYKPTHAEKAG